MGTAVSSIVKAGRHSPGLVPNLPVAWWSLLGLLIVAAIGLSAFRSVWRYDPPEVAELDRSLTGQFDFHNGVYFPTRAFLDGVSPYGEQLARDYPVTRALPMMSPLMLVLHAPLAILPVRAAEIVYFALNCLVMALLANLCVRWIDDPVRRTTWYLVSLLLIVASRAGHTTLFTGYLTAWMVIGTLLALSEARARPWLSALGVAIASCKPTYAVPLFLLMVARGDYSAAGRGLALSLAGAGLGIARLLLVATPTQLWQDFQHGQAAHMEDSYELPINTWTRIDALAVVAKWLEWAPSQTVHLVIMTLLLPLPAIALWRLQFVKADYRCAALSSGVIAVSILATLYHHVYDALLLFPITIGLVLGEPSTQRGSRLVRWLIAGLLLLVAWNYPSSELFIKGSALTPTNHRLLTSTGPIAMTAAWLGLCALPWLARSNSAARTAIHRPNPTETAAGSM